MCKHDTLTKIRVNHARRSGSHEVNVDSCIAEELQELNDKGVLTLNSCCGHSKTGKGDCLIDIRSTDLCSKLGYEVVEYTPEHTKEGIVRMDLKTQMWEQ